MSLKLFFNNWPKGKKPFFLVGIFIEQNTKFLFPQKGNLLPFVPEYFNYSFYALKLENIK